MSNLIAHASAQTEPLPSGLEDRMKWLCRFGKPRVSRPGRGWHASIEMNTNTTGASFDVKSDFDCESPSAAVDELVHRMIEALVMLGAWEAK